MNTEQLQNLRREYQHINLDITPHQDPIKFCEIWLKQAIDAQMPDATAMVLATANKNAEPSARVVLLKGIENQQFIFYSHYKSHKGEEIAENPVVALHFFWPLLERQILIKGHITPIEPSESDAYFGMRPRASQIATIASHQSQVIDSREDLIKNYERVAAEFADKPIPRPKDWGGYAVTPTYIEFWQGRESRLHDRIAYSLNKGNWLQKRLSP
ncbi:MAG: pyridoxamine 5'-phosphate oxidase [Gammaproteobacteria bacterium]|jgi:pyridoxamine 5'-phosphate oxidase